MRNRNKDIVIHSLVEKKLNLEDSKTAKYDYSEALSIAENRAKKLKVLMDRQKNKESEGWWMKIVHEKRRYEILVKKGENIEERKTQFFEKLKQRAKKSV